MEAPQIVAQKIQRRLNPGTRGADSGGWATMDTLLMAPAAIAMTLLSPDGTDVCPALLAPQAMSVPSFRRAKLWSPPAAIAVTLLKPGGMFVLPAVLLPYAMTAPSLFRARS